MSRKKVYSGIEIALLVIDVFAIAYIMSQIFYFVPSVSAQLDLPQQTAPQTPQQQTQSAAGNSGINSQGDYGDQIDQAVQTGQVSPGLLSFLQSLNGLIPEFPQIDGGQALQNMLSNSGGGVKVCPLTNNNEKCQNYLAKDCAANCQTACIEHDVSSSPLPEDNQCALGVCYDADEGTCAERSTREYCQQLGGDWKPASDQSLDNLCRKGCCVLDTEARFTTERECNNLIEDFGLKLGEEGVEFKSDVWQELVCLGSYVPPAYGACTTPFGDDPTKSECKFVTKEECKERTGSDDNFHENMLCSHPSLNSTDPISRLPCVKQNSTQCVEGLDEVYWFDSCGNIENIYWNEVDRGYNGGFVLNKNESCVLGDPSQPLQNQAICGNCNRFLSSRCGNETIAPDTVEELNDNPDGGVVCRDMGCYEAPDLLGNRRRREHGESWCAYQSSVGLPGNDNGNAMSMVSFMPQNPIGQLSQGIEGGSFPGLGGGGIPGIGGGVHATDTPGSRHFRAYCQNGEIKMSQCDDYRNEVCVEQQTPKGVDPSLTDPELLLSNPEQFFENIGNQAQNFDLFAGTFSQASCRVNRWQECLAYNPNQQETRLLGMLGPKSAMATKLYLESKCGQDPDCFLQQVKVGEFEFYHCTGRYKPGFYTKPEDTQTSQGSVIPTGQGGSASSGGQQNQDPGANICGMGTQKCTAVYIKESNGFSCGDWVCKANCDCVEGDPDDAKPSQAFVKAMNDYCISLGDCGYHANYVGDPPGEKGYGVKVAVCDLDDDECGQGGIPDLGQIGQNLGGGFGGPDYYPGDANPQGGEYIQASSGTGDQIGDSFEDLLNNIGFSPEELIGRLQGANPTPNIPDRTDTSGPLALAGVTGAMGLGVTALGWAGVTHTSIYVAGSGWYGPFALGPFAGAAMGAAAGMALTTFLMDITGIAAGLNPVTAYSMIGASTVAGGVIGYTIATEGLKGCAVGGPPACIVAIAVIIVITIWQIGLSACGVGDKKKVEVTFECQSWTPPSGGAKCEMCGQDLFSDGQTNFTCSKYSCETLGTDCVFAPDSEKPEVGGVCVAASRGDVSAPVLVDKVDGVLSDGFTYYSLTDEPDKATYGQGFKVRKNNVQAGCIDQFERFDFGFRLDEFGRCRMSAVSPEDLYNAIAPDIDPADTNGVTPEDIKFELMKPIPGGLSKEHKVTFSSRDLTSLGRTEALQNDQNDLTLYVACEDYQGASNVNSPFEINLCVNKRDLTAVQFLDTSGLERLLGYNLGSADLSLRVNEAAQCKWDTEEFDFETEGNNFEGDCRYLNGNYVCTARNIQVSAGETRVCVKCKDHPEWASDSRNEGRNVNSECWWQTITQSRSPLTITRVVPANGQTFTRGASGVSVVLEVETSGGVDGTATCKYTLNGQNDFFDTTGSRVHKQPVTIPEGIHNLVVDCGDRAFPPNTATASSTFTMQVDSTPPSVTGQSFSFGSFRVTTNEKATCAYSNEPIGVTKCGFNFEDSGINIMGTSNGLTHNAPNIPGKTYYVKCKDEYGNMPLGCNTEAREAL